MSGALVTNSQVSGASFVQQGSVDWVALSNSTLSFSVEVLSRFSKAGVEIITIAIGQALFSGFNVPADGQKRLSDSIAGLKSFASYGNVLWFGFGIKHVVRTLCETEQGATCAAICACLSVSYDSFFASQVLKALADESKVPGALTPALSQWSALLSVCAGAVENSQFPLIVEGFSRLMEDPLRGYALRPLHTPTNAKALAGALRELSRVSNGAVRSVTLEGGIDCGWLAAIAQWLLCLRVEIISDAGNCLYSNFSEGELYAQVTIIRCFSPIQHTPEAKIISRSYSVPPGSLCFSLLDKDGQNDVPLLHFYSSGRSEWHNILKQAFGSAAETLLHPENAMRVAEFLCSGFQPGHKKSAMEILNPWGGELLFDCAQQRRAFLKFSAFRLPELTIVMQIAEINSATAYENSVTPNHNFSKGLTEICPCSTCSTSLKAQESMFCLHRVGITIFRFLWILSWLDIDSSVKPSPTGLLTLYYASNHGDEDPEILRRKLWQRGLNTSLMSLFSGSPYVEKTSPSVSAISEFGICIYQSSLKDPTVEPSQIVRNSLVYGTIQLDGSNYRKVIDKVRNRNGLAQGIQFDQVISKVGPDTHLLLVAEETVNSKIVEANFHIKTQVVHSTYREQFEHQHKKGLSTYDQLSSFSWAYIGVAELQSAVMDRINVVRCAKRHIAITTSIGVDQSKATWAGRCSQAVSALWTSPNGVVDSIPRPGEWLLSSQDEPHCCISLLRGNYPALYSVICHMSRASRIYLTIIDPCFLCSLQVIAHKYGQKQKAHEGYATLPITSYSILTTIASSTELVSSMARSIDTSVLSKMAKAEEALEMTPKENYLKGFYILQTRKVLESILRHRGITLQNNIAKRKMIQMLLKNDIQNPQATQKDRFPNEKDFANVDVVLEG